MIQTSKKSETALKNFMGMGAGGLQGQGPTYGVEG